MSIEKLWIRIIMNRKKTKRFICRLFSLQNLNNLASFRGWLKNKQTKSNNNCPLVNLVFDNLLKMNKDETEKIINMIQTLVRTIKDNFKQLLKNLSR